MANPQQSWIKGGEQGWQSCWIDPDIQGSGEYSSEIVFPSRRDAIIFQHSDLLIEGLLCVVCSIVSSSQGMFYVRKSFPVTTLTPLLEAAWYFRTRHGLCHVILWPSILTLPGCCLYRCLSIWTNWGWEPMSSMFYNSWLCWIIWNALVKSMRQRYSGWFFHWIFLCVLGFTIWSCLPPCGLNPACCLGG